jgi:acyl-CoA synthetase (AMP-forming)/AMP-acid ligase II
MLNDPLKHAAESSLSNRFEKMATLFHDNLALVSDTETNTYGQLNDISNKLANALLNSGLMRGERVALLMSHDTQLFVGMLSILKAGMVVVTLRSRGTITNHS